MPVMQIASTMDIYERVLLESDHKTALQAVWNAGMATGFQLGVVSAAPSTIPTPIPKSMESKIAKK